MYHYGIRGVFYNWIKNYLCDRKQFTFINNIASNVCDVHCGVPQGSVLGPLLFLLYINDIGVSVPNQKPKLFADDTNLFIVGSDLKVIEVQANLCLQNMEKWFYANKLSLNIDKTFYMLFGSKSYCQTDTTLNLFINVQRINKVVSCKYLGVIIDEALKWEEHIDYVYKKIIRFSSILYKLRNIVPQRLLNKIYYAFIHPYIAYGIEVYANASQVCLDKLIKANNKILRIMLNKKLDTSSIDLYTAVSA